MVLSLHFLLAVEEFQSDVNLLMIQDSRKRYAKESALWRAPTDDMVRVIAGVFHFNIGLRVSMMAF